MMPDFVARKASEDGNSDAPPDLPGEGFCAFAFQGRLVITDYRLGLLLKRLKGQRLRVVGRLERCESGLQYCPRFLRFHQFVLRVLQLLQPGGGIDLRLLV